MIVAASNMQRAYPAMAVEIQDALGVQGYGFDMNVACSSATFGIQQARDALAVREQRRLRAHGKSRDLQWAPELPGSRLPFHIRRRVHRGHRRAGRARRAQRTSTRIVDTRLQTIYSNNIRNNFGFLNRGDESGIGQPDKLFVQEGRKVFKEVCPAVARQISAQLERLDISPAQLKRMWLHQANLSMNQLIGKSRAGPRGHRGR